MQYKKIKISRQLAFLNPGYTAEMRAKPHRRWPPFQTPPHHGPLISTHSPTAPRPAPPAAANSPLSHPPLRARLRRPPLILDSLPHRSAAGAAGLRVCLSNQNATPPAAAKSPITLILLLQLLLLPGLPSSIPPSVGK